MAHTNNAAEIRLALIRTVFNTMPAIMIEVAPHMIAMIMSARTALRFGVTLTSWHVTQRCTLPLIVCSHLVHSCHRPILKMVRVCPLLWVPTSFFNHPTTSLSPIQQANNTAVIWMQSKKMKSFEASIFLLNSPLFVLFCVFVSIRKE